MSENLQEKSQINSADNSNRLDDFGTPSECRKGIRYILNALAADIKTRMSLHSETTLISYDGINEIKALLEHYRNIMLIADDERHWRLFYDKESDRYVSD